MRLPRDVSCDDVRCSARIAPTAGLQTARRRIATLANWSDRPFVVCALSRLQSTSSSTGAASTGRSPGNDAVRGRRRRARSARRRFRSRRPCIWRSRAPAIRPCFSRRLLPQIRTLAAVQARQDKSRARLCYRAPVGPRDHSKTTVPSRDRSRVLCSLVLLDLREGANQPGGILRTSRVSEPGALRSPRKQQETITGEASPCIGSARLDQADREALRSSARRRRCFG